MSDAVRDAAKDIGTLPRVSPVGDGVGRDAAMGVDIGGGEGPGDGGDKGGVERYSVSLGDGEFRYCLVVTSTDSEEGGMTVPGAVQGQESTRFAAYDLAVDVENDSCCPCAGARVQPPYGRVMISRLCRSGSSQ